MPERIVGDRVVLAHPDDGRAVVLDPFSSVVWVALDEWTTSRELESVLGSTFDGVEADRVHRQLVEALDVLERGGLLERPST